MDTHEANQLMEESLRCLARMMEQIKLREIGKVVGWDEPMQDHLAQSAYACIPSEHTSFKDCIEYLVQLHKGFEEATEHEILSSKVADREGNNYDITHIADMVMGGIFHKFPDDLLACAKEIYEEYFRILPPYKKYVKNDKGCRKVLDEFIPKVVEIIKKHDLQTWKDGEYSLPIGYLETWMARNYWQ